MWICFPEDCIACHSCVSNAAIRHTYNYNSKNLCNITKHSFISKKVDHKKIFPIGNLWPKKFFSSREMLLYFTNSCTVGGGVRRSKAENCWIADLLKHIFVINADWLNLSNVAKMPSHISAFLIIIMSFLWSLSHTSHVQCTYIIILVKL